MIDQLLAAALVGTTRQPDPPLTTGTPYDAIAAGMPPHAIERGLLLAAGALHLY